LGFVCGVGVFVVLFMVWEKKLARPSFLALKRTEEKKNDHLLPSSTRVEKTSLGLWGAYSSITGKARLFVEEGKEERVNTQGKSFSDMQRGQGQETPRHFREGGPPLSLQGRKEEKKEWSAYRKRGWEKP